MKWSEISPKVKSLQENIVAEMNNLTKLSSANDNLPKVSETFKTAKDMVEHPSYNVVVCGEVKKGKSSLLNAIVGQELLPVNVEIATSQVFRVSNCEQESFALVFTDGTKKTICRDELVRYGSQVDSTLETQEIFRDHTLAYIEVNIPVAFLPKGVSLVDTPGLGAMYKSHEWITQNYVKNASAVVFVMDPERPLVEKEKEFILKVLEITPNILYVMTKIDMYNEDVYNSIIARNEELLALIYAEKNLTAPSIYLVSSKSLMNAAVESDEEFREEDLRNSRFPEFKEQLLLLVYKAVGLTRTGIAIQEIRNHFGKAKTVIEDMLRVIAADNAQEQADVVAQKQELQNRLRSEMGVNSTKWNETKDNIVAICNSVTSKVQQLVSSTGPTYKHYERQIDDVNNLDDLKKLKASLDRGLCAEIDQQWSEIMSEARRKVNAELYNYHLQMDSSRGNESYINLNNCFQVRGTEMKDYLPPIRTAFWITGVLAGGLGLIFGPLAPLYALPLGVVVFRLFWTDAKKRQIKNALAVAFNGMGQQMLFVQGDAKRSVVGEFSYQLLKSAEAAMQKSIDEQQTQIQREVENLEAQIRQDAEGRQQQFNLWKQISEAWSAEAERINKVLDLHKQIRTFFEQ